jgi:hypothetical protein
MLRSRLICVAVLGPIALGACYRSGAGGTEQGRPPGGSGDELAFLPQDSELVVGLDARQILASPLWKHFEPRIMRRIGKSVQDFRAMCGYDPLVALRGMTVGVKLAEPIDGVFVVRGLPRDQTIACAGRALGQTQLQIKGGIITVPGDGQRRPPAVMAFADATTLVIATSRERLDAALAAGAPLRRSGAFSVLWALVDARHPLWGIVNGTSHAFDSLSALGVRPRAVLGSIELAGGLSLTGRMRLGTPDEATQLASLGQAQAGALQSMADKVEVGADGPDVTLRVDLSIAQVDSLAGIALQMGRF